MAATDWTVPVVAHGEMNDAAKQLFDAPPAAGFVEAQGRSWQGTEVQPGVVVFTDVTQWASKTAAHATVVACWQDPDNALPLLGAQSGVVEVWLLRGDALHRTDVWTDEAHAPWLEEPAPVFGIGTGFPGRALALRQTIRCANLAEEAQFTRRPAAAALGLQAAVCVPFAEANGVILFLGGDATSQSEAAASALGSFFRQRADAETEGVHDARVRAWADAASDAFVSLDSQGKVVFASKSIRRTTGRNSYDFLHRAFLDFVGADFREDVQAALITPGTVRFQLRADPRWLEAATQPTPHDETVVVIRDVTAQATMEEDLRRSNLELEQFAYAASHDLQAPLRAVSGYLQILESEYEESLAGEAKEYIARSVAAAQRMRSMINALLAYSRVETRGHPMQPVDLDQTVSEALENLGNPDNVRTEVLPEVIGDPDQLIQLMQNLVENAIKFGGDGEVVVDASETSIGPLVRVADHGPGVPLNQRDRIFRIFQRLHRRDEHPGTGIGLALCRRIMDRHGGTVELDAGYDEGARFLLQFPMPAHGRAADPDSPGRG